MSTTIYRYTYDDVVELLEGLPGTYDAETDAHDIIKIANEMPNPDGWLEQTLEHRVNDHEPIPYLTNHVRFRGLDLFVDQRTLIPRPETEPLVEVALDFPHMKNVLDVGTGCGAVALAVKNESPDRKVVGVDISKDALDVASINATKLELDVEWYDADLIKGVKGDFQIILANLPYLPTNKKGSYAVEMESYEPEIALWGGDDGYSLIRRLLALAARRNGVELVALEIGLGQEQDVFHLFKSLGYKTVFGTTDKKGDLRCMVGRL